MASELTPESSLDTNPPHDNMANPGSPTKSNASSNVTVIPYPPTADLDKSSESGNMEFQRFPESEGKFSNPSKLALETTLQFDVSMAEEPQQDTTMDQASPARSTASSIGSDDEDEDEEMSSHVSEGLNHSGSVVSGHVSRGSPCSSTDEYCQEPFETYQHKVSQLCRDIGLGELLKIERMKGGSFNRVVGLTFPSPTQRDYVLRIPRSSLDEDQAHEIKDQVSVLLYLSQHGFLQVPRIAAFDITHNNALESQYVLMERLQGTCVQDVFYNLPLPEKLQITTIVAELLIKLESIGLDKPGRLIGTGDLPDRSHIAPVSANAINITGYRNNPMEDMPSFETQHIVPFITSLLDFRKQEDPDWDEMVERCERLQTIAKEMEGAGLIRNTDIDCVLWHWDLSARNILIRQVDKGTEASGAAQHPHNGVTATKGDATLTGNVIHSEGKHQATKGCLHQVQIQTDDGGKSGAKHTVDVRIEDPTGTTCNHKVQISVEDHTCRVYRHTIQINSENNSDHIMPDASNTTEALADDLKLEKKIATSTPEPTDLPFGEWVISGVLDWDDVLSVPLVLARKPPSWLWCDEDHRDLSWDGNRDTKPDRDLTEDELLIKAHFDQIMARNIPTYIEDAYHRGPWLRALARFAIEGFGDGVPWKRCEQFLEDWEEYYVALKK